MCEPLHSWNHRTFGSKAWLLSVEVLVIIGDQFSTLKICSPKICLTWPTTLGVCHIYGSYKPAGQVGMQPPTAHHMGEGMPTYTHLMPLPGSITMRVRWHSFSHQPQLLASAESALLTERLPPYTTLLTSTKPANLQNADKESSAEEDGLDDKFGAEDNGPSEGYTFFGVDLKPVLPVALAVSTVIGGLCMLLVQA